MKNILLFFLAFITISCEDDKPQMYYLDTEYEFDSDFTFNLRADRILKDSFHAESNFEALKKAKKIFAIKTQGLTHVYLPKGLGLYNSKKKRIAAEKLSTKKKNDLENYEKIILDSLEKNYLKEH